MTQEAPQQDAVSNPEVLSAAIVEQAVKEAEQEIAAMPRDARLVMTLQAVAQNVLAELAEEARAAGQLQNGQVVIRPEDVRDQLIAPFVAFLATDVQNLGVVSLDELVGMLTGCWTTPPEASDEGLGVRSVSAQNERSNGPLVSAHLKTLEKCLIFSFRCAHLSAR